MYDLIVIGGGAAGYFGAIRAAELKPQARILILEKSARVLDKVRISGGGRCNVTHACFDPKELSKHYPRGERELLGPFHRFMCGDMMAWLDERGVETAIEDDGRVFPASNLSSSIIDCFEREVQQKKVEIQRQVGVRSLSRKKDAWVLITDQQTYTSKNVLVAAGSSSSVWKMLSNLSIPIVAPVPSLFTFKINSPVLSGLMGLSVQEAEVHINQKNLAENGPTLITHWGLSGPAVLRLSAWGANDLAQCNYDFDINVNWTATPSDQVQEWIAERRKTDNKKSPSNTVFPEIPKRLWERFTDLAGTKGKNWSDLSKSQIQTLHDFICNCQLNVKGKTTFKEEFVTAGGVDLKAVDFRTMESKDHQGLFFAGEVLNVDAITGGFNFQAAWTTSWIAAESWAERL